MESKILAVCGILLFLIGSISFSGMLENPSFELPEIDPEGENWFVEGVPPGWNTTHPESSYRTVRPPFWYEIQPSEGFNFLHLGIAGPTANINQTPSQAVASDTLYILEIDVSCLATHFGDDLNQHAFYVVNWVVGGSSVHNTGVQFLTKPSWTTVKIVFNSADHPATVGQTMTLYISGKKVAVDNVRLNAYTPRQLTIEVDPDDIFIDTVDPFIGEGIYADGVVVGVKANYYLDIPNGLYVFSHWNGPVADPNARTTTVTMDADKMITAVYDLDRRECIQRAPGIMVLNSSFEKPVLDKGEFYADEVPHWDIRPDRYQIIYNPPDNYPVQPTSGNNLLSLTPSGATSHWITQILPGQIQANTLYTFTFDVATLSVNVGAAFYNVVLYATKNGQQNRTTAYTLLSTGSVYLTQGDAWSQVVLQWDSTGSPLVGERFDLVIYGGRLLLDNIQVSPEGQWGADVVLDISADSEAAFDVALSNRGFELPVLADSDIESSEVPGWTIDSDPSRVHWIFRPPSNYSLQPSQGANVLYLSPAGPTAQISQITESVIEPNSLYRLEFDVASPGNFSGDPVYYTKIYATKDGQQNRTSGYLLYDGPVTDITVRDSWVPVVIEWDSSGSPHAGIAQFDIVLGGKAMFDNLRMQRVVNHETGSIWPSPGQYVFDYYDTIYLYNNGFAANCPDMYLFDGWEGDVTEGTGDNVFVVMNADKQIKARYHQDMDYVPECGDVCTPFMISDLNWDCITNFEDFSILAEFWLETIP